MWVFTFIFVCSISDHCASDKPHWLQSCHCTKLVFYFYRREREWERWMWKRNLLSTSCFWFAPQHGIEPGPTYVPWSGTEPASWHQHNRDPILGTLWGEKQQQKNDCRLDWPLRFSLSYASVSWSLKWEWLAQLISWDTFQPWAAWCYKAGNRALIHSLPPEETESQKVEATYPATRILMVIPVRILLHRSPLAAALGQVLLCVCSWGPAKALLFVSFCASFFSPDPAKPSLQSIA